ncbi:MAG TPA: ACP S-malonyltransferase [Steroidobacteraceae bacterium]|jgi:[acyl-carrier-protein] S-malonyltransferase|nr:ACP S-malonyltransferase [Steroidobacteraceae bacterium]
MPIAMLFPGQGSQAVGMMASLAGGYPAIGACFSQASQVLGFDLWRLVGEGPAEQLNVTEFTQPAMLVAGIATWRAWCERGGRPPAVVAGHSLGEFTALVCAESIGFEDAVRLVRLRGQLMQQAVPEGSGAMAAILGLEDAAVEEACAQASQGEVVQAVNFNSPAQVVIAGHSPAVDRAMEIAKQRGAKRAVRLPVSVPAHSALLQGAAQQFAQHLATLEIREPRYRFFSGVDAAPHGDPADIRAILSRQLASPVRWTDLVRAVVHDADTLVECGPGKVLTGLNKRIERGATCLALENAETLGNAVEQVGHA